ncbi:quorum sensing histidine kinase QseC [Pantoea dispersa]|uniref:quorum sensing histidine kinase QseC n=1 Tax=Pantoea TaxID=53335 RepID=UPI000CE31599|nr:MULTISPECIES: quorum sensing histidine kinase QseC [Pantoea]MBS0897384.1 two-component system sensor histidine kinase QseC [Pantoea dispersa]NIG36773.1 two-component system sensor histidine kinase QseC [Pantoea sp. Ap-959]PPC64980.1 two-component system sensor histidine kinase QseC [Pantoea sp. ICBG 828]WEA05806.1 quorum sensing histidine kinase QseC [Pantoea dispersa]
MSLFLRLAIGFLLLIILCGASATFSAWQQTRDTVNELFDTQQMLFAKRLLALDASRLQAASLPKTKAILRHHRGDQDDDALAFAVFSADGKPLLNDGENGRDLPFTADRDGFHDGRLRGDDDRWRLLWLTSADKQWRVVVGQEWEYRDDMTRDLALSSLLPWLVAMPLMLLLLLALVWFELRPLKRLTASLQQRVPDDATPLTPQRLPLEVKPLVAALNGLFARMAQLVQRERRFTSDAAHELRSPLAALRVQSEVIQLAGDDEAMRNHALQQLDSGILRATRLVDQLLTLSRVEADDLRSEFQPVPLAPLLHQLVTEHQAQAATQHTRLTLTADAEPVMNGHPLLLGLLLRNLLDNALRYTPSGSEIQLRLSARRLEIADNGPGVSAEQLARLGERFWRPPGQAQTGSGLGLSIVKNVAQLHGIRLTFSAVQPQGLRVTLSW